MNAVEQSEVDVCGMKELRGVTLLAVERGAVG